MTLEDLPIGSVYRIAPGYGQCDCRYRVIQRNPPTTRRWVKVKPLNRCLFHAVRLAAPNAPVTVELVHGNVGVELEDPLKWELQEAFG